VTTDRERVMWVNVVLQAIRDATEATSSNHPDYDRAQARAWFKPCNPDFIEVCHNAHLDPEAVYQKAKQAIARYDAAIAKGERYALPYDKVREDNSPGKPKREPIRITFNGETLSPEQWSLRTGIKAETIRHRLSAGFQPEQLLHKGRLPRRPHSQRSKSANRPGRKGRTLTFNGMTKTITEWSVITGTPVETINRRIRAGLRIDDILSPKRLSGNRTRELHTVNGKSLTLQQWADHLGISYEALMGRMRNGRTLAEAIAMPSGRHPGVVSDFQAAEGTGAHPSAQEIPNLEISE
jgi:hypothetical protein